MLTEADKKTALKDNDFTRFIKTITFDELVDKNNEKDNHDELLERSKSSLHTRIEYDAHFFSKQSIIDYSLLLGEINEDPDVLRQQIELNPNIGDNIYFDVDGRPYVLGIIDPLTGFK